MPDGDLASLIEQAVTEKLERIEARRFGKTKRPRKGLGQADTWPGGRHISAPVRRIVSERDEEQCTFVSEDEKRCPAREGLEYHHDDPHGRGGDRSPADLPPFSSTTRKQKIHETWPSCNASTSKLSGC